MTAGVALVLASAGAAAQDIAPFRITDFDGFLQVEGLRDSHVTSTRQLQTSLREELFLLSHGYIYHPNLLLFDLGGGIIYEDARYTVDGEGRASGKPMYDLVARAEVLRGRPYNGGVYYERLNPTLSVGPAEVLFTESEGYGARFSLLEPVTPAPLFVDASRTTTTGQSSRQTLDQRVDQLGATLTTQVARLGQSVLRYRQTRLDSSSGSLDLPIQDSVSDNRLLDLDTRLSLGHDVDLYNLASLSDRRFDVTGGQALETQDARFLLDLRGRHATDWQSFARYTFSLTEQRRGPVPGGSGPWVLDSELRSHEGGLGLNYRRGETWFGSLEARGERSDATEVSSSGWGASGSAEWRRELPVGRLALTYTAGWDRRQQDATQQQAEVIGEALVLAGTQPVALSRPRVVPGSVVVSNADRSQTFIEGLDYRLSVVGDVTRIERLVGGNILDGQDVLVDYAYDVGGTYGIDQLNQSVSVGWNYRNLFSTYVRYFDSAPRLTSGSPTFEINPVESWVFGARSDVPIGTTGWSVGGFAEYEDRDEVIAPGRREQYEAYLGVPLPVLRQAGLQLSVRRSRVQYDLAPEQDSDLEGFSLRAWGRLPLGIDLSLEATRERDVAEFMHRRHEFLAARASWRLRLFEAHLELRRSREQQQDRDDDRTVARLWIRRSF